MKLLWLALTYATLLTWPGHWIAPAYQSLLLALTGSIMGTTLSAPANAAVDLSASNLLVTYVALCLASSFATWRRRLLAIVVGLGVLVAVECATGVLGISLALAQAGAVTAPSGWHRVLEQTLELSRWLAVPLAWGALLGHRILPSAATLPGLGRARRASPAQRAI